MTPDVYTNLRILNCTDFTFETSFGSYQMQSWFPNAPSQMGPKSYWPPYLLQFQRGGGDENDAGYTNFNLQTFLPVFLYAGSTTDSAHYMQVTLSSPGATLPLAVGLVTTADWPQSSELSSLVSWSLPPTSPDQVVANLGALAVPNTELGYPSKALAIVDLSQIYSQAEVATIQSAIQGNSLTPQQMEDLWTRVSSYTQIVPSS